MEHAEPPAGQQEKLQEAAFVYQLLQQRLEELSQQAAVIERAFFEVKSTQDGVKSLKDISSGELLIPIGNGCYIKGRGSPGEQGVLVGITQDILVEKTAQETDAMLEKRTAELQNALNAVAQEMKRVSEQMNAIAQNVQKG